MFNRFNCLIALIVLLFGAPFRPTEFRKWSTPFRVERPWRDPRHASTFSGRARSQDVPQPDVHRFWIDFRWILDRLNDPILTHREHIVNTTQNQQHKTNNIKQLNN